MDLDAFPIGCIINEYQIVLVKMQHNTPLKNTKAYAKNAKTCLNHLIDIWIMLGLVCITPMLQLSNTLIKFAQSNDVFSCNFLTIVKMVLKEFQLCHFKF